MTVGQARVRQSGTNPLLPSPSTRAQYIPGGSESGSLGYPQSHFVRLGLGGTHSRVIFSSFRPG